jgi:hypothetical protein
MPDPAAPAAVQSAGPRSVYRLPAPDDDPRFSYGLIFDVADVLTRHGYPRPDGTDWADLMLALSRFLYQPDPEASTR